MLIEMPGNAFHYYTELRWRLQILSNMMCSVVEFKMKVLEELLSVLSSNRKIFLTAVSLDFKMLQLILLILFRRANLSFV